MRPPALALTYSTVIFFRDSCLFVETEGFFKHLFVQPCHYNIIIAVFQGYISIGRYFVIWDGYSRIVFSLRRITLHNAFPLSSSIRHHVVNEANCLSPVDAAKGSLNKIQPYQKQMPHGAHFFTSVSFLKRRQTPHKSVREWCTPCLDA